MTREEEILKAGEKAFPYADAWYHQDEGWHFATGLTFEPTHWMPLSQPPKKGGEE